MIRDLLSTDHVIISSWHHTSMVLALDVRSRTVGSSNIPSCLPAWHGKLTTWTLADSQSFPPTWASPFSHIHKYLSPHVCTRQSRTAVILSRSSQVFCSCIFLWNIISVSTYPVKQECRASGFRHPFWKKTKSYWYHFQKTKSLVFPFLKIVPC